MERATRRGNALVALLSAGALVAVISVPEVATAQPPQLRASGATPLQADVTDLDPGVLPSVQQMTQRSLAPRKLGRRAAARSQCQFGSWGALPTDKVKAAEVLRGKTTLSPYGVLRIAKNPSWRAQAGLDYSGDGHIHSLFWALPLLRTGVATKNRRMVNRFYALLADWIKDNPPSKPRLASAYGQIEMGFRMLTMSCALAGPVPNRKLRKTIRKSLLVQATYALHHWSAVNNASFHEASGIFAAGCALGSSQLRSSGGKRMAIITKAMVEADGSVREGSIWYARNTYIWTQQEIARIRACGARVPAVLNRSMQIPEFLAYGVRPDGRWEALGDSVPSRAAAPLASTSAGLSYAATQGTQGTSPKAVYRRFNAGFVFGRSGWGVERPFASETFYSIRTGPGPGVEYHAHNDQGAVTVYANGRQLLFDTGQYRYTHNAAASFVRSRQAHNMVTIPGLRAGSAAPTIDRSLSTPEGDFTSLTDRSYRGQRLRRSIWYDRVGQFFVVMDDVATSKARWSYVNWNLGRDRTVTKYPTSIIVPKPIPIPTGTPTPVPVDPQQGDTPTPDPSPTVDHWAGFVRGTVISTSGPGADASLISVGNTPRVSVASGRRDSYRGWNSSKYGELVPSPSVHIALQGKSSRFVTVVIPRAVGVTTKSVSARAKVTGSGALVHVTNGGAEYLLSLTSSGVVRIPIPGALGSTS